MAYMDVNTEHVDMIKQMSKSTGKKMKDYANEAFSFYFAYIGFLQNEKNTIIVLEDLAKSDKPEEALEDVEKLMKAMFHHFAPDSTDKYFEVKKILEDRINGK